MKKVAIVFTGGTISMQPDPAGGGARPVLDGAQILALAPGVGEIADLQPIDWGMVPASHLRFGQLLDIAALLRGQLARPDLDGAVVVQGTDTIEETAFAFDLLLTTDKPVVVTGAMRDASAPDYEGPRNLVDAVRCAVAPELAGLGVMVVMAGSILAAVEAVKAHTTALDAFGSRDGRPLGRVVDNKVEVTNAPNRRQSLPSVPSSAVEDVHLVSAVTGMDGTLVRCLAPLRPAGLVIAATGAGNTHPDVLEAAQDLIAAGTVVCLSTRCPAGAVAPIYGFPGGGATWRRAGALLSKLDGPKTRVALALGLAAGLERAALADLIER